MLAWVNMLPFFETPVSFSSLPYRYTLSSASLMTTPFAKIAPSLVFTSRTHPASFFMLRVHKLNTISLNHSAAYILSSCVWHADQSESLSRHLSL